MEKKDSKTAPSVFRRLWQKRSVQIITYLVVSLVVALYALRIGIKIYLQNWLLENGADVATIEKVQFNPFTGVAALNGADVQKNGIVVFSDSTIYVNIGITNLLRKNAFLQSVTLANIVVDVEKYENGRLRIGSYTFPAVEKKVDTAPELAEEVEKAAPWIFYAKEVNITNVTLHYHQPDLEAEIIIEDAHLDKFNTDPGDMDGALKLKASFNGAPVEVDLTTLIIIPSMEIEGNVSIADLRLDNLEGALKKVLKQFKGVAGMKGQVRFVMNDDVGMQAEYDGAVKMQNGDIAGKGWAIKAGIDLDGKATFTKTVKKTVVVYDGNIDAQETIFNMPQQEIDIDNADLALKGKNQITIADSVIIDSEVSFELAGTKFAMKKLAANTGNLSWDGKVLFDTGNETKALKINAEGKLAAVKPACHMEMENGRMEVSDEKLSWDGRYEYTKNHGDGSDDTIITDGILTGEAIAFSLPDVIELTQPKLNVTGKTQISLGKGTAKGIGLTYQGNINLEGSKLQMKPVTTGYQSFTWSGDAGYTLNENSQDIALKGDLNLTDLFADLPQSDLHISEAKLTSKPDLTLTLADKSTFSGNISLDLGKLLLTKDDVPMLSLDRAGIKKVRDNGSGGLSVEAIVFNQLQLPSSEQIPVQVSVPSIAISGIKSPDLKAVHVESLLVENPTVTDGKGEKELVGIESIKAESLQASKGSGIVLDTITIDSIYSEFVRSKATEDAKAPPEKGEGEASEPEVEEKEKTTKIPLKINQVIVTGNSGFKFTDNALEKSFITIFALESLNVLNLDLAKPEQPFTYELKGTFDKYSPLSISGTCAPLAKNLSVEQKTELLNYSMLHISPYVMEAIGAYFTQGQLDLTSTLNISGNHLDMENKLLLKDVEAKEVEGALAEKLDNQLPVPLDMALSMLRDGDGNVDLDVPISGKISDLDLGLSDIITTPILKAINVALVPYLAYTVLGPTGALVFLGAQMGKKLLKTYLPSLEYDARQIELTEKQKKTLLKVGKKIEKDSDQNYSICARVGISEIKGSEGETKQKKSTESDKETRRELFKLGEERSLAVKDFLLNNFKIVEERLLICNPGINFDEDEKPTIEFKK